MPLSLLAIFGTRPEAVKLAPLISRLRADPRFSITVCVTAQHRQMLDQVLAAFGIVPDHDLNAMTPGQTLTQLTARLLAQLEPIMAAVRPDWVVVQGDTTSTFVGALAAFYAGVPVAHVEAGLRTGDLAQPFPEEANRVLTARLASAHFAATAVARRNLLDENVSDDRIWVTGNTGIDAVLSMRDELRAGRVEAGVLPPLAPDRRLILVTAHRRESFGEGLRGICNALNRLALRLDVEIVFPLHPNPAVRDAARRFLHPNAHLHLMEPLDYVPFVGLMDRSYFILSDSGGVQEEAPALGRPVLVLRDKTERPEGVEAGAARLVGTDSERIFDEAIRLLDDPIAHAAMAEPRFVYGDGRASGRIADALLELQARRVGKTAESSVSPQDFAIARR